MQKIYTLFLFLLSATIVSAQIDQLTTGPGYSQMAFYSLQDGQVDAHDHTSWDIAFDVFSQRSAGIFVNEGVGSSQSTALPVVELYRTDSISFAAVRDTLAIGERLHNPERTWSEGAFNTIKSPQNPLDFGWGIYEPTTNQVMGGPIYVIKLRDGTYRKIRMDALANGAYSFTYANLAGTDSTTQVLNRQDYAGKTLAYFSFETESFLDLEPESWDLLYTRYTTPLDDGEGNILQYIVTGILLGRNVEVAVADSVDPVTVTPAAYDDSYTDSLAVIGHEWKLFDLNTFQWSMDDDLVFFIKSSTDSLWKIQFIDFEGASTGTATLEKTLLGTLTTTTQDELKQIFSYNIFPNPTVSDFTLTYQLEEPVKQAEVTIYDISGQQVYSRELKSQPGLNVKILSPELAAGLYFVQLKLDQHMLNQRLMVRP